MKKEIFWRLAAPIFATAIAIAFAAGWLAAEFYALAHPPSFEILEDFRAEIPLIRLESFDGQILRGKFEGVQPRFLLGEKETLVVPNGENFELNLKLLK